MRSPSRRSESAPGWATLLADLRTRAFRPGRRGERRLGAEVELLAVDADTRRPVPTVAEEGPATLPLLRRFGALAGWVEERTPAGAPLFRIPDSGLISYEPGGQIELSTLPCSSVDELVAALHGTVLPLRRAAEQSGIRLLGTGMDPLNPVEAVPLQLHSERYRRMDRHFARIGPAGRRMMRQTAALQISVDWEDDVRRRWRLLNGAAPLLTAVFANSPARAGATAAARSHRALAWRQLDSSRTGAFPGAEPAPEYLGFALGAAAILMGDEEDPVHPFRWWLEEGSASAADWDAHLSTLFPEVRPKGYAEVRCIDALEPEWYAVPPVLLAGLLYHEPSAREASALVGPPDPSLLVRAAVGGMADPEVGRRAEALVEIALRGARALPDIVGGASLETAEAYAARYTRQGRSPADDLIPPSTAQLQLA